MPIMGGLIRAIRDMPKIKIPGRVKWPDPYLQKQRKRRFTPRLMHSTPIDNLAVQPKNDEPTSMLGSNEMAVYGLTETIYHKRRR